MVPPPVSWWPSRHALPSQPLPAPSHLPSISFHTPELVPCFGGLVDVALVQWALVACLLAQGLMELELQDKTHKIPAGTGRALRGLAGVPCPGTIQLPTGLRLDQGLLGRTTPGSGGRLSRISGKNVGTIPGNGGCRVIGTEGRGLKI